MKHRSLGRTGMQVSPLCLGAMMFGARGEPDHDTSIGIIHRALDAGINFIDTADAYSRRRVRSGRRQGAQRAGFIRRTSLRPSRPRACAAARPANAPPPDRPRHARTHSGDVDGVAEAYGNRTRPRR